MVKVTDFQEISEKIVQKLEPSGWANKLRGYLKSMEFEKVLKKLYELREEGKRFTPPLKNVFSAFENCPVKDLKVIMIGQDPYPYMNVADGMAFSCSITNRPQPSLKFMFEEIDRTVNDGVPQDHNPDLTRWANQGVLLLNTALTCEIDKVGTHYDVWKDFIAYVVDMLNFTDSGLIFILMGKQAQGLESIIGSNHYILTTTHPASAAHNGTYKWDCKNIFNEVNRIITMNNGKEYQIKWTA